MLQALNVILAWESTDEAAGGLSCFCDPDHSEDEELNLEEAKGAKQRCLTILARCERWRYPTADGVAQQGVQDSSQPEGAAMRGQATWAQTTLWNNDIDSSAMLTPCNGADCEWAQEHLRWPKRQVEQSMLIRSSGRMHLCAQCKEDASTLKALKHTVASTFDVATLTMNVKTKGNGIG